MILQIDIFYIIIIYRINPTRIFIIINYFIICKIILYK